MNLYLGIGCRGAFSVLIKANSKEEALKTLIKRYKLEEDHIRIHEIEFDQDGIEIHK